MHRDADGARLIGDGTGDGLADPPRSVGGELVAAAVLELVYRLHQTDVAFLNQVQELQTAVGVLLGDGNHQAKVGFDQLALGVFRFHVRAADDHQRAAEILSGGSRLLLELADAQLGDLDFLLQLADVVFAAGVFHLALEAGELLLQRANLVNKAVDLLDQALALAGREFDRPHQARNTDALARQQPADFSILAGLLGAGHAVQTVASLQALLVAAPDGVDLVDHVELLGFQLLFSDLFVVEDHHFLDRFFALFEGLSQAAQRQQHHGRAGHGLEHVVLTTLDALGDLYLTLAGEQRHGAHFAQVHAHRIVGLLQRAGSQIEVEIFAGFVLLEFQLVVELGRSFHHLHATGEGRKQIIELIELGVLVWLHFVHAFIEEAFFLATLNQLHDAVAIQVLVVDGHVFSSFSARNLRAAQGSQGEMKNRIRSELRQILPQTSLTSLDANGQSRVTSAQVCGEVYRLPP